MRPCLAIQSSFVAHLHGGVAADSRLLVVGDLGANGIASGDRSCRSEAMVEAVAGNDCEGI